MFLTRLIRTVSVCLSLSLILSNCGSDEQSMDKCTSALAHVRSCLNDSSLQQTKACSDDDAQLADEIINMDCDEIIIHYATIGKSDKSVSIFSFFNTQPNNQVVEQKYAYRDNRQVLCQVMRYRRYIVRIVKEPNGSCYQEIIKKATGQAMQYFRINCENIDYNKCQ